MSSTLILIHNFVCFSCRRAFTSSPSASRQHSSSSPSLMTTTSSASQAGPTGSCSFATHRLRTAPFGELTYNRLFTFHMSMRADAQNITITAYNLITKFTLLYDLPDRHITRASMRCGTAIIDQWWLDSRWWFSRTLQLSSKHFRCQPCGQETSISLDIQYRY